MDFKYYLSLVWAIVLPPGEWTRVFPGARAEGGQCIPSDVRMGRPTSDNAVGNDIRRLRNDLLCDYDRLVVKPGTDVEVNLYIFRLHLDVNRGFLQILVDLGWRWNDPRLRWDPSQYSDVNEVVLNDQEIWVPDLEAMNSMQQDFNMLSCLVRSEGNVTCNPVYNLQTTCGNTARRWPLDEHECVIELASRNHDSREYSLVTPSSSPEVERSEFASSEWMVVKATQTRREATINTNFHFTRLEIRLTLRRNKYVHVMTVGVPTIVLPSLILAQLWVDPHWPGRLLLGCTTVASLCLHLQYLSDTVPDDTQGQAPLIVLFYRDCLVIAVVVVVLTVVLRSLSDRSDSPPPWLTGSSSWLLRTVPRPITGMLLEDDDDDDDEDEGEQEERANEAVEASTAPTSSSKNEGRVRSTSWRKIARIVDRVVFLALLITFAVLLFAAVP